MALGKQSEDIFFTLRFCQSPEKHPVLKSQQHQQQILLFYDQTEGLTAKAVQNMKSFHRIQPKHSCDNIFIWCNIPQRGLKITFIFILRTVIE